MRILLVITELDEGGAENALVEVARGLQAAGDAVEVVALFHGETPPAERLRSSHIPVTDLRLRPWSAPAAVARLRAVARRFQPNLVHSWLFHANFAARLAVPKSVPLVCGLRVVEPRRLHIWLDRLTRRRATCAACVSNAVAEFAVERLGIPPGRVRVIGNGVSPPPDPPPIREREKLRGLTVARVTPQKGLDVLLGALARLPGDLDWHWSVAGAVSDPAYATRLWRFAQAAGITERIEWLGAVPRERMAALYAEANLFVLPSRWEGQPNALLEAMAWRLPAVATAVDGTRDLEHEAPGCFELVPTEDVEALAAAVTRVFEDREFIEKRAERIDCLLANHTWEAVCRAYRQLYGEVLTGRLAVVGRD